MRSCLNNPSFSVVRILLIDNSNTRTKFALANEGELLEFRAIISTADISEQTVSNALSGQEFSHVFISSVVPEKAETLSLCFPDKDIHILSHTTDLGITIDYPQPSQIGADRLANSVGVSHHYGSPAIVVDFGTAVTFDVVSPESSYIGGVIAPGLAAMTSDLKKRTALLPQINLEEPDSAIGKSTTHAMQSGAVFGYRGLVRGILNRLCKEIDGKPHIVATGGDAELITRSMPEIHRHHPDLTLEGMRLIAARLWSSEK